MYLTISNLKRFLICRFTVLISLPENITKWTCGKNDYIFYVIFNLTEDIYICIRIITTLKVELSVLLIPVVLGVIEGNKRQNCFWEFICRHDKALVF